MNTLEALKMLRQLHRDGYRPRPDELAEVDRAIADGEQAMKLLATTLAKETFAAFAKRVGSPPVTVLATPAEPIIHGDVEVSEDALKPENTRRRVSYMVPEGVDLVKELQRIDAELRHAYRNLLQGQVTTAGAKSFARGLLGPQIERLEKLVQKLEEVKP